MEPVQQPKYGSDLSLAWYSHGYTESSLGVAVLHLE